jgi:hypothetical protein
MALGPFALENLTKSKFGIVFRTCIRDQHRLTKATIIERLPNLRAGLKKSSIRTGANPIGVEKTVTQPSI